MKLSDAQADELLRVRDGFGARNSKRYVTRRTLEKLGLIAWGPDGLRHVPTEAGRAAIRLATQVAKS